MFTLYSAAMNNSSPLRIWKLVIFLTGFVISWVFARRAALARARLTSMSSIISSSNSPALSIFFAS